MRCWEAVPRFGDEPNLRATITHGLLNFPSTYYFLIQLWPLYLFSVNLQPEKGRETFTGTAKVQMTLQLLVVCFYPLKNMFIYIYMTEWKDGVEFFFGCLIFPCVFLK